MTLAMPSLVVVGLPIIGCEGADGFVSLGGIATFGRVPPFGILILTATIS